MIRFLKFDNRKKTHSLSVSDSRLSGVPKYFCRITVLTNINGRVYLFSSSRRIFEEFC